MKTLDLSKVSSVYSGAQGKCCCGCSGKHSYASQHREWASKNRGYAIDDDQISDRSVKIITGKINKAIAGTNDYTIDYAEDSFVSAVSANGRLIVAYLKKD